MYKIEIWQYYSLTKSYESDNIKKILRWYKNKWQYCYDCGGCTFDVYEDGVELSFDEKYELGFY